MPSSRDDTRSSIVPSPSLAGEREEAEEREVDFWKVEEDQLVRVHEVPRVQLFIPLATDGTLPVDFQRISTERFSIIHGADGTVQRHDDDWTNRGEEITGQEWTGETRFKLLSKVEAAAGDNKRKEHEEKAKDFRVLKRMQRKDSCKKRLLAES